MRRTIWLIWIFMLALQGVAVADSVSYAVSGQGGFSPAITGVSADSFWWASTTGTQGLVPGSALTSYGLVPITIGVNPAEPYPMDNYTGSLLLSTPFMVDGTQGVTVTFGALAASPFPYEHFEFGAILENSQVIAVLGVVNPMFVTALDDGGGTRRLAQPSSGVETSIDYRSTGYPQTFQLGGTQFDCALATACQVELTSSYTPQAGTYQLLFGAYSSSPGDSSAVAVKAVEIPEAGWGSYLCFGCVAIGVLRVMVHFGVRRGLSPTFIVPAKSD